MNGTRHQSGFITALELRRSREENIFHTFAAENIYLPISNIEIGDKCEKKNGRLLCRTVTVTLRMNNVNTFHVTR